MSRPTGNNGYRNVVAACRECNNRKSSSTAEDWLRTLYREGFLDVAAFQDRQSHLARLRAGELKPAAPAKTALKLTAASVAAAYCLDLLEISHEKQ